MDQIQVWEKWTGFHWWVLHLLMPISKWTVTYHFAVFLCCQWVTVIKEDGHFHDTTNMMQRQWPSTKPGSFRAWINVSLAALCWTWCKHNTNYEDLLLSPRHAFRMHTLTFLACLVVFSIRDKLALPNQASPSRCSLWEPARAVLSWLVLICFCSDPAHTGFVGQLDSHQNLPS